MYTWSCALWDLQEMLFLIQDTQMADRATQVWLLFLVKTFHAIYAYTLNRASVVTFGHTKYTKTTSAYKIILLLYIKWMF